MNEIIVYHGGTDVVKNPICKFGRRNLDFGQGFYVTNIREQAVKWAENISRSRNKPSLLNRYKLNRDAVIGKQIVKYLRLTMYSGLNLL